jgi:uncharacterized protein (TIGR02145 family)
MIILKEQETAQTFSFIPRELKATTIVLRNETTGSETNIAADFFLSDYYLTTTTIFDLKENTFYNLTIKNNNDIVYKDKVFCTNQQSSTYTVNENQYATPIEDNDDYITPDMDDTVTIGTQVWATKNLDIATYTDGTVIPLVQKQFWAGLTTGAWCYYNDDPASEAIYGKLYNGYAVLGIHDNDPNTPNKTLAPVGYHIPTDAEWTTLTDYLGGASVSGGKMKSTGATFNGTGLWNAPNTDATNSSGFSGLPGGFLQAFNGAFNNESLTAYFWSSSEFNANNLYFRYLQYNTAATLIGNFPKINGFSVRLIKDI